MFLQFRNLNYFKALITPNTAEFTRLALIHVVKIIGVRNERHLVETLGDYLNLLVSRYKVLHYCQVLLHFCLIVFSRRGRLFGGVLIQVFLVDVRAN